MRPLPNVRHLVLPFFILCAWLSQPVPAQQPAQPLLSPSGQVLDEDFAKSVKEWTTRPEFISPLVDHLPKVQGVPMPKDILGYHAGQPKKLRAQ